MRRFWFHVPSWQLLIVSHYRFCCASTQQLMLLSIFLTPATRQHITAMAEPGIGRMDGWQDGLKTVSHTHTLTFIVFFLNCADRIWFRLANSWAECLLSASTVVCLLVLFCYRHPCVIKHWSFYWWWQWFPSHRRFIIKVSMAHHHHHHQLLLLDRQVNEKTTFVCRKKANH